MSFSFLPKTVLKTKSKISGEIVVKEQLGKHTIYVQNLIQSGGVIKDIWQKPLKKINKASQVLILGLGGGTVVQLIKKKLPQARITAIEIDKEIIKIGKKYFGLKKIKDLEVVNADAIDWVGKYRGDKVDLILVDLYLGGEFPPRAMNEDFLEGLKKILSKEGLIIFNWLKNKGENQLVEKLEQTFPRVKRIETATNLFLACDKIKE